MTIATAPPPRHGLPPSLTSLSWQTNPNVNSHIHRYAYRSETKTLFIQFADGSVYSYASCTQADYDGLAGAPSKGKHFHAELSAKEYQRLYHPTAGPREPRMDPDLPTELQILTPADATEQIAWSQDRIQELYQEAHNLEAAHRRYQDCWKAINQLLDAQRQALQAYRAIIGIRATEPVADYLEEDQRGTD